MCVYSCVSMCIYMCVSISVLVSAYLCLSVCLSVFFSHENAPVSVFFEFRWYSGLRSLAGKQALHKIRRDLKGKWSPILSAKSLVYDWSLFHSPVRIIVAQLCSLMINENAVIYSAQLSTVLRFVEVTNFTINYKTLSTLCAVKFIMIYSPKPKCTGDKASSVKSL